MGQGWNKFVMKELRCRRTVIMKFLGQLLKTLLNNIKISISSMDGITRKRAIILRV